jgi:hypothetical protein
MRGAIAGAVCAAVVAVISILDPTLFGSEWLLRE